MKNVLRSIIVSVMYLTLITACGNEEEIKPTMTAEMPIDNEKPVVETVVEESVIAVVENTPITNAQISGRALEQSELVVSVLALTEEEPDATESDITIINGVLVFVHPDGSAKSNFEVPVSHCLQDGKLDRGCALNEARKIDSGVTFRRPDVCINDNNCVRKNFEELTYELSRER